MVSIIVPIYNVESFLRQCIDSILNQTYQNIEVLLIDDGSSDSSGRICDEYGKKDSRVKVIHQENMGVSVARNTGIVYSLGQWISFVDGDDWLDDDAIEKMINETKKHPDGDIFIASYYSSYPEKEFADSFFKDKKLIFDHYNMHDLQMSCLCMTSISKRGASTNVGVPWARLYRSNYLKDNDLKFKIGLKRMQDAIFHLTAFEFAKKVYYSDIPVYHYRIWKGGAGKRYIKDFEDIAYEINLEIIKYIERFRPGVDFLRCYYTKVAVLFMDIIRLTYAPSANTLSNRMKLEELQRIMNQDCYKNALKNASLQMLSTNHKLVFVLLRLNMIRIVLKLYEIKDNYSP